MTFAAGIGSFQTLVPIDLLRHIVEFFFGKSESFREILLKIKHAFGGCNLPERPLKDVSLGPWRSRGLAVGDSRRCRHHGAGVATGAGSQSSCLRPKKPKKWRSAHSVRQGPESL